METERKQQNHARRHISRTNTDDFSLPKTRYNEICKLFNFEPEVDLFASTILHKTDIFYSKIPTLGSSGANALNFKWDRRSYCHPPKNLCYEVFKKIEAEKTLDLVLIMLSTWHDADFARFLKGNKTFKGYVKKCAFFESRIHFPGKDPSRFMTSYHSWYTLHIVKKDRLYDLKLKNIYHLR